MNNITWDAPSETLKRTDNSDVTLVSVMKINAQHMSCPIRLYIKLEYPHHHSPRFTKRADCFTDATKAVKKVL